MGIKHVEGQVKLLCFLGEDPVILGHSPFGEGKSQVYQRKNYGEKIL